MPRFGVGSEQRFLRFVALDEPQQELVHVVTRQETIARQARRRTGRLGPRQRAEFAATRPGHQDGLKRHQHRTQSRTRTAHAARDEPHAPVVAAENIDQPTRVTIGPLMKNIGRLELHGLTSHFGTS